MGNNRMKILVVDDEELICWSLKRSFEKKEGHTVCCVNTGDEALKKVMEDQYDVIITDLKLPDVSGTELIKKINEVTNGAPMIVMSSHFPQPTLEDITSHGVFRCITKPFQIEDIISGVKEAAGLGMLPPLQGK